MIEMAFRYINPGNGALFNDSAVSTVENNFTYNPNNGISFSKSATSLQADNRIPLAQAFTTDIYAKFNMYVGYNKPQYFYLGAKSTNGASSQTHIYSSCFGVRINNDTVNLLAGKNYDVTGGGILTTNSGLKTKSLNTIQFHIHRGEDAASSFGELSINGTTYTAQFTNDNYQYDFSDEKAFFIQFPTTYGATTFISELIVSNDAISPKEKILALPISSTQSDMTAGNDGIYIANAAAQTLLQTPNVADLITAYGANSSITGIAVVGNPAYKTGEGITTLTGLSKASNVITEHGACALSNDSLSSVMEGWSLNNTTIADLQNMQFGWKVGA